MEFIYTFNGVDYPVVVTKKHKRGISYRVKDGIVIVYASFFASKKDIISGLERFKNRLFKENPHLNGVGDDYIYILGEKVNISYPGSLEFSDGKKIKFKDKETLIRKLKKWFKEFLSDRNRYYEHLMGTYENKVYVREMTTRYGSNSVSNHSIRYSFIMIHYSVDVIDSIIIHELAHCKVLGHGQEFYKIVYKYCPNYDNLHRRLRKGEFKCL